MPTTSKRIPFIFLVLFLASSVYAQETAKVLSVVDGDTIKVHYKGKEESVRLIGIDTPESRMNQRARMESQRTGEDLKAIIEMGKKATRFVRSQIKPGDQVRIELDIQSRDGYGRLLGYIFLANDTMLNEGIVKAGFAYLLTIPPNVKYKDRFLKAYREARENRRGLWK